MIFWHYNDVKTCLEQVRANDNSTCRFPQRRQTECEVIFDSSSGGRRPAVSTAKQYAVSFSLQCSNSRTMSRQCSLNREAVLSRERHVCWRKRPPVEREPAARALVHLSTMKLPKMMEPMTCRLLKNVPPGQGKANSKRMQAEFGAHAVARGWSAILPALFGWRDK